MAVLSPAATPDGLMNQSLAAVAGERHVANRRHAAAEANAITLIYKCHKCGIKLACLPLPDRERCHGDIRPGVGARGSPQRCAPSRRCRSLADGFAGTRRSSSRLQHTDRSRRAISELGRGTARIQTPARGVCPNSADGSSPTKYDIPHAVAELEAPGFKLRQGTGILPLGVGGRGVG